MQIQVPVHRNLTLIFFFHIRIVFCTKNITFFGYIANFNDAVYIKNQNDLNCYLAIECLVLLKCFYIALFNNTQEHIIKCYQYQCMEIKIQLKCTSLINLAIFFSY